MADTIKLSIVVVVYRMPRQAMNTLYSLSRHYQQNLQGLDYEVIVVENDSGQNLDATAVQQLGSEFRYCLRKESSQSPVPAINFGLSVSEGTHICLMIDGARMLSPRALEYIQMGCRAARHSLVAVPGYSLGWQDHHFNLDAQYDEQVEQQLLREINWQQNGYRLFDIAIPSGANSHGIFNPFMECNCITSSRENFEKIGGADTQFMLPGGGSVNLHMYRQLGLISRGSPLFVIGGEGSFHQYHGGVTTSQWQDLEAVLQSHREQLHAQWPNRFSSLSREPTLLGNSHSHALTIFNYSSHRAFKRGNRLSKQKSPLWPDDNPNTAMWEAYERLST